MILILENKQGLFNTIPFLFYKHSATYFQADKILKGNTEKSQKLYKILKMLKTDRRT